MTVEWVPEIGPKLIAEEGRSVLAGRVYQSARENRVRTAFPYYRFTGCFELIVSGRRLRSRVAILPQAIETVLRDAFEHSQPDALIFVAELTPGAVSVLAGPFDLTQELVPAWALLIHKAEQENV